VTSKALGAIVAGILGITLMCGLGAAGLVGGTSAGCTAPMPNSVGLPAPTRGWPRVGSYRPDQVGLAATIVSVGAQMGVPARGWVIAVATAIQESGLSNPSGGDRDSVGLFQQRPSQGWGTPEQLHDPVYASQKFYTKLLTIPHWQRMPLTQAAQAVQRSAYPDAYAKWEPDATELISSIGGGTLGNASRPAILSCGDDGGDGQPDSDSAPLPANYTLPATTPPQVVVAIHWALGQLGTSYVFGGSCTDPHGPDPAKHCDCSSLMQQAYRAAGINIPRTTNDQVGAGAPVAGLGQVRPGDLLFIPGSNGTPAQPGHVGMYIGDNLLIQAPHTGDTVKITKLSQWALQISTIRRLVNP
jgi:cell wall-associated NlpC family hydrolase